MALILADANLDGHAELMRLRLASDAWRELRDYLDVQIVPLISVGLDAAAKDDQVWRICQREGYYLLTANRNLESEDSLEATLRREGTDESLPVLTLADPDRALRSTGYLDMVVESLLDYLLNAENIRGAGRLYLP